MSEILNTTEHAIQRAVERLCAETLDEAIGLLLDTAIYGHDATDLDLKRYGIVPLASNVYRVYAGRMVILDFPGENIITVVLPNQPATRAVELRQLRGMPVPDAIEVWTHAKQR